MLSLAGVPRGIAISAALATRAWLGFG
jgi:hypothetical protein